MARSKSQDILSKELRNSIKKLSLEQFNDTGNVSDARLQGFYGLESVKLGPGFIEKYLNFHSCAHIHFIFIFKRKTGEIHASQWCAIYQRMPSWIDWDNNGSAIIDKAIEFCDSEKFPSDNQYAVFVDDVEFRNDPEFAGLGVFPDKVRSLIRLQFLDQCKRSGGDVRFELHPSLGERRCIKGNGEKGLSCKVGGLTMENRQLINQMVEGRPEIVDDITDDQSPIGIIGCNFLDGQIPPCPPRVLINNKGISLFFRAIPGFESRLELIEVVLRSIDFLPNTNEAGSCHAKA